MNIEHIQQLGQTTREHVARIVKGHDKPLSLSLIHI